VLQVFDATGRFLGEVPTEGAEAGFREFKPLQLAGLDLRGIYWAREPISGARVSFFWPGRRNG
jgi:hypothetical protein